MTTTATISKSPRAVSQPHVSSTKTPTVMLAGNPNAGKTNLFNALTGLRQKVANYPGVTVERVEGRWTLPVLESFDNSASDFRASSNGDKSSNAKISNGFHSNNHPASNALFSTTNETEIIEVASLNDVRPIDDNQAPSESVVARIIDLPGLYSLDALSPDELIARKCLAGEMKDVAAPDCIIAVVDATNLERNLFLVTQLLDFDSPLVVALTMYDLAQKRGLEIDVEKLSARLSVPVVPIIVSERRGLTELAHAVRSQISSAIHKDKTFFFAKDFAWRGAISSNADVSSNDSTKWQDAIARRYKWIEATVAESVRSNNETVRQSAKQSNRVRSKEAASHDMTSRIDRWATHKVFGLLIFLALMLLVFQSIFAWATLPMELIDKGFGTLGEAVRATLPTGLLTDLLVDGIIAGVGGVLVFLPQISLLFLFIALLEDTGYMARAAFLMDRLMRGAGLHGKAFVPLLSSFACAIPGIMATRTIENPRDRIATILIAPLMSCSARLPVYTLMIAAFFADRKVFGFLSLGAIIIMAMYGLGIVTAIIVALLLKRTVLRAPTPPLVMEMPPYRVPHLPTILQTVWTRAFMFIRRAGTVILAISIILWALVTFPRTTIDNASDNASNRTNIEAEQQNIASNADDERAMEVARATVAQATRETGLEAQGETAPRVGESIDDAQISNGAGAQLRNSFAGRFGHFIEPVIAPLGFDWRTGIGLIASFAAREVFVSTMSIVYNVGADEAEESPSLIQAFHNARRADGSPVWTPLTAVSLMVFFVLACQCMSTVAITRRETNSWKWAMFMVAYMLVLAYAASFIVYQGGRLLGYS